jgi:integrase
MAVRQNEAVWIDSVGRWQINVQRNGQRKTFTCSTPTKKGKIEAERKADKWLSSMSNDQILFTEAWGIFIANKRSETGTPNCKKLDSIYRTWLDPALKRKRLSMITCQDWQNIINSAAKAGRSKRTCQNIRSAATSFYAFARNNRWEMEKPEYISVPKFASSGERTILQPNELNILFSEDYITHYNKKVFVFYIYAYRLIVLLGLRRGELAGLMHADIKNNVLHICRSRNSLGEITGGKTENADRKIYLPAVAKKILEQQENLLTEYQIESQYLFPDPSGDIMDTNKLYDHWDTYRKQHGIKSSLHELRHTMISMMKADMPEQLLKPIVGHGVNMDTFAVYGHEVDGDLERASEIIDNVFQKLIK